MRFSTCRRAWVFVCLVGCLAIASNVGVAHAAFPGQNGLVAYEDGGTVAISGGPSLAPGSDPSWSSDGQESRLSIRAARLR